MKFTIFLLSISLFIINGCGSSETKRVEYHKTQSNSENTLNSDTKHQQHYSKLSEDVANGKVKNYDKNASIEERYLAVINYVRSKDIKCNDQEGLYGPVTDLQWSDALAKAAQEHSNDMLIYKKFSHYGSGNSSDLTGKNLKPPRASNYQERIEYNGYEGSNLKELIGKVTSKNSAVPDDYWIDTIDLWIKSTNGHCSILFDPELTDVGMAEAANKDKTEAYYTADFGNIEPQE